MSSQRHLPLVADDVRMWARHKTHNEKIDRFIHRTMVHSQSFALLFLLVLAATSSSVVAFTTTNRSNNGVRQPLTQLAVFGARKGSTNTKPTFNKSTQTWEKSPNDDGKYPYDAVGALLRHGPSPFIARLSNPKEYEQGILKYMAVENVDRSEATGNMDAKLNNAADWAYRKMEEKRGAPKVDYTRLDKKQAILVTAWALIITPLSIKYIADIFFHAS